MNGKEFLGRGLKFPLQVDPKTGRLATVEQEEDIREAIGIILHTGQGERVMRPEFGARTLDYAFAPVSSSMTNAIAHDLRLLLLEQEPRIRDVEVSCEKLDQQNGSVVIHVTVVVEGCDLDDRRVTDELCQRIYEGLCEKCDCVLTAEHRLHASAVTGFYCTAAIDSGENGFGWNRVVIRAQLPPDTMLRVYTRASDSRGWGDWPNLEEGLRGLTDDPVPELRRIFGAPAASCGDFCANCTGRYLWLLLELSATGEQDPRVDGLRIEIAGDHMNARELVFLTCDQVKKILRPQLFVPGELLDFLDELDRGRCPGVVQLYALWRECSPGIVRGYEALYKKNAFWRFWKALWIRTKRALKRRKRGWATGETG